MAWLKIIGTALSLAKLITGWVRDRGLMNAGKAEARMEALEKRSEENAKAKDARLAVRADIRAGKLRDTDGHRRD